MNLKRQAKLLQKIDGLREKLGENGKMPNITTLSEMENEKRDLMDSR